ncbi:hypothetical protein F5884DRAFT_146537 [Xylogone sp. PMI_703]|nr:hypothetical protein F5884DRAFT_146537 [Xylogone sp. PMI_703]
MRLLQFNNTGEFSFTEDLVGDGIPPYAILSHTWGLDNEEVTFDDMTNGIGKDKPGYKKIWFCREQARQDGLLYFWIDTCCINKNNKAELSQAINSMFRWYHNATQCYVYLSDVSTTKRKRDSDSKDTWKSDFRKSRWFTRGWTLQELLAPASVEFFSRECKRLGNKRLLEQEIHEITGISKSALHGDPLSQFSVDERMSWINPRQTKFEEDKAYSLLGIFGVYISPFYGEGIVSAFRRLQEKIDKLEKCIQDLRHTDPRNDKKRIEDTKGGLLDGSYRWILENSSFQQWRNNRQNCLLWIKGDPGKGKTMLLCGIVNELKQSIAKTDLLSYFFCQATDSRINNATAVLRGLVYLLVDQQPSLISYVCAKYDQAGKTLFEDTNAWVSLSEIFTNILRDPSFHKIYLIVDGLDECIVDLPKLLDFITQTSSLSCIKWIVSSRNWPSIEKNINKAKQKAILCLELNEESITAAVTTYIQFKVNLLATENEYENDTKDAVLRYLVSNANSTFLWVSLVCQELAGISGWEAEEILTVFPPGLDELYRRMMDQISNSKNAQLCKSILAIILVIYRPITLDELVFLVDMPARSSGNYKALAEIIGLCGSFLTLRDRNVFFVHQSAKDFLTGNMTQEIFPSGIENIHRNIFLRSLQIMSRILRRDIYNLRAPGFSIDQVKEPDFDPLAAARYSCVYWVDHLLNYNLGEDTSNDFKDSGSVHKFLLNRYLYWLEALSLLKNISNGIIMIRNLENKLKADESPNLYAFIHDAKRFALYNRTVIEERPLQIYCSALIFAPRKSLIRNQFKKDIPPWLKTKPKMQADWSAVLQTLEGHSDSVTSVAFSPDGKQIVSGSYDNKVRLWDAATGEALQIFEGHSDWVTSVAFSPDGRQIVLSSYDRTVRLWDAVTRATLQIFNGHSDSVTSIAFSPDDKQIVSGSNDRTVRL